MKSTVTGHCPRQPSPARCSIAFLGVRGEGSGLPEWLRTAGRAWEADNNPAQNPWLTPERAVEPRGACARSNSGGRGPKFLLGSSTPTVWNLGPSQSEGQVDTSVLCEPQKGHIQEGGLCLRNKGCTQDIHILAKYEASRHKPKVIGRRFTCPV